MSAWEKRRTKGLDRFFDRYYRNTIDLLMFAAAFIHIHVPKYWFYLKLFIPKRSGLFLRTHRVVTNHLRWQEYEASCSLLDGPGRIKNKRKKNVGILLAFSIFPFFSAHGPGLPHLEWVFLPQFSLLESSQAHRNSRHINSPGDPIIQSSW